MKAAAKWVMRGVEEEGGGEVANGAPTASAAQGTISIIEPTTSPPRHRIEARWAPRHLRPSMQARDHLRRLGNAV